MRLGPLAKRSTAPLRRCGTDAIAFLGGAQSTNEECYLWTKMVRLFGSSFLEHQARL